MSFARHQSFYIRANWFAKAIEQVNADPRALSSKDSPARLGIGKNMVESLRFWLVASGLAISGRDGVKLTSVGEVVRKHDPYFEDDMTWLLVHYGLTSDEQNATSWYLLFNEYSYPHITEGEFIDFVRNEGGYNVAYSSLKRDYDCLLATYVHDESEEGTPEDSITCPLRRFGFLEKVEKGVYRKAPSKLPLPPRLLYYVMRKKDPAAQYYTMTGLIEQDRNVGRIFNLTMDQLYLYLQKLEETRLANYSTTAGVNSVALENKDQHAVLIDYYKRGHRR
jgi:hypothetical protein